MMIASGNSLFRPVVAHLADRVGLLAIPGSLALILALLMPAPLAQAIALVVGVTLFAVVVILKTGRQVDRWRDHVVQTLLLRFLAHDATPSFLIGPDNRVVWMNDAARSLCPEADDLPLTTALKPLTNDAPDVLRRLQDGLRAARILSEDAMIRRGHARFVLRRMGRDTCLFRLEALQDRGTAGLGLSTNVPLMTVSKSGTILSMNDALRSQLGRRARHLDSIFADPVPEGGGPLRLTTAQGEELVRVYVTDLSAGRREIAVLPLGPDTPVTLSDAADTDLDALPVALLKLGRGGRILHANRAARALLTLPPAAPVTMLGDLMTGLGRSVSDWVDAALDAPAAPKAEVLKLRGAREETFLQVALARALDGDDSVALAILHDATELKTLEAQFVQSQKMQAIGQLAGGVAHDFNNLLTAISGHCDLLLLRHDVDDPDYADLVQINQNANRAASLVGQLLAYSRKQTLLPEVLDVRDALADLTHLLNRLVGERVTLSLYHDPALPMIRADKRQLEQVIMNLVVNARDAMPDGGEIVLETRQVVLNKPQRKSRVTLPAGDYVCIAVRDTGQGIPPDILPKVFDPFFTTKRIGEGTGLGLSTAYGIVKQSGGFIFAESEPGQGSEFTLYFPVHTAPLAPALPDPAPPPRTHGPTAEDGLILLVEDEAPVRAFAARALRLRGYTVIEAENAEDALEALDNPALRVDLIVTDVVMPGLDGPSWVRQAQETRPDLRVVFVSGYAEEFLDDQAGEVSNFVFLPKPFSLAALTDVVQRQMAT